MLALMPIMPDIAKAEAAIVELANAFRRESALGELKPNAQLTSAALSYARFLAGSTIFSHEADGRRPADRIKAAGYAACQTAENLAWMLDSRGFETMALATRMVEGWKVSPPHRKNMLLAHVTETGVAIAKVTNEQKYIAVQLLGRPESLKYTISVENRAAREVRYTLGPERISVKPNQMYRHTLCEPKSIEIELASGGLLGKSETRSFPLSDGLVFKLSTGKGGQIAVEVQ